MKDEPTTTAHHQAVEPGGAIADSSAPPEPAQPGVTPEVANPTEPIPAPDGPEHPDVSVEPPQPAPAARPPGVVAQQLALGSYFSCALMGDSSVRCWGSNRDGQLGDGTNKSRHNPARVSGLTDVVSIAAGSAHVCGVTGSGEVWCWGHNRWGQLGDGTTDDRNQPVRAGSITDATAVVAGSYSSCALVAGGKVECWGSNGDGGLGDGSTDDRSSPVEVKAISGATSLAAGASHTCAMLDADDIRCWGGNSYGQLGDDTWTDRLRPTPVIGVTGAVALAAAENQTAVIDSAGRVMRWGYDLFSGGARDKLNRTPQQVFGHDYALELALAGTNECARDQRGAVKCRGDNSLGALGNGTFESPNTPEYVTGIVGATALAIARTHGCAAVGVEIRCWGDNTYGELGVESPVAIRTAQAVSGLADATALAVRDNHSCALTARGTVVCWGLNNSVAQLGIPEYSLKDSRKVPEQVKAVTGVLELDNGGAEVCARVAGGDVTCWVWPQEPLVDKAFAGAQQIAVAQDHACKLSSDGTVKCWGGNYYGQLGDGTTKYRTSPALVQGVSDVVEIDASGQVSCARRQDGTVWCWGKNDLGQVGNGSTSTKDERGVSKPARVAGVADATAIAVGDYHSCALIDNGSVRCWGYNKYGGAGDGTTEVRSSSVEVSGVSGATAVAVGTHHSCALTRSGAMCWGRNTYGALGDGTYTSRATAVAVPGISGAIQIDGGLDHTCALIDDGTVRCWGAAGEGQLGEGTWRRSLVPVTLMVVK